MKGNALLPVQENDHIVLQNEDLAAAVKFPLQHKMTVELPPNIKLRLEVETTDINLNVSKHFGRLGESCTGETAGGDRSPRGAVDEGGVAKWVLEIQPLDGILKFDKRVSRFSSQKRDFRSSLFCFSLTKG
jgi:hypothetical protein